MRKCAVHRLACPKNNFKASPNVSFLFPNSQKHQNYRHINKSNWHYAYLCFQIWRLWSALCMSNAVKMVLKQCVCFFFCLAYSCVWHWTCSSAPVQCLLMHSKCVNHMTRTDRLTFSMFSAAQNSFQWEQHDMSYGLSLCLNESKVCILYLSLEIKYEDHINKLCWPTCEGGLNNVELKENCGPSPV